MLSGIASLANPICELTTFAIEGYRTKPSASSVSRLRPPKQDTMHSTLHLKLNDRLINSTGSGSPLFVCCAAANGPLMQAARPRLAKRDLGTIDSYAPQPASHFRSSSQICIVT
jgi:hypothetical protein